ncbi:amidohydrolase [Lutibacter sp. HS1-25]|uniref:amidohydrolase n=1 Tax=Lutibacter sp. HS1-25 TaxID=2485000 RepID=UPI0010131EE7|nr:amidohydrolase [Lutibacter sp. HS1-25]RXP59423.1 amidohydrolase [Lutibacter sp. HS1-25]
MQDLKIALIQTDIVWQNAAENRSRYSEKINNIQEQVDVFVLPEMFTTGFSMHPEGISETMQGKTVAWMKNLASKKNAAICGSVIISEENNYYNRLIFAHPNGKIEYYNKRHLFTLAGEEKVYAAGSKKLIVDYKGWKICPLVCYDLRFPVWSRNKENYDVLLYVANWPKPRIAAWDILLKARSVENLCYTIGVNRVGLDASNYEYNGHSEAYDCLGKKLTNIPSDKEFIEIITLQKEHLNKIRTRLNFLNDQDCFEILD